MNQCPTILGIVNITRDSFSDGGRCLEKDAAVAQSDALMTQGADAIDLGAAASNPDAESVPPELEIARLHPVVEHLRASGTPISIDSFATPTQRWALEQSVDYLNDIHGFADSAFYDELASASCKLIVMHSVQAAGAATRVRSDPDTIYDRITRFFEARLTCLLDAGVARSRLILDPGMGFFLGERPEVSMRVLHALPDLRKHFELPLLISVSRKSFLGALTGAPVAERGVATLVAELYALKQGASYIRTHDARLRQFLAGSLADR